MLDTDEKVRQQLRQLADYLAGRRRAILDHWRECVQTDSELQDVSEWTHTQFYDHIPAVLKAFDDKLRAWPHENVRDAENDGEESDSGDHCAIDAASLHSRHRWQQGYDLRSLVREWGHLNQCQIAELYTYAAEHCVLETTVLREAHLIWGRLFHNCTTENVVEYMRLLQAEAATRAVELEQALHHLQELEEERGEMLRTATHDLRGGLAVVMGSATMMHKQILAEEERAEFRRLFKQGSASLNAMLTDLMSMARLEAGQEERNVEAFDAGQLLETLCTNARQMAEERGLYLCCEGPDTLPVEGDAVKVQRIAQNLLLNGLKYTREGGVSVTWGDEGTPTGHWELIVEDTGPGLESGPSASLAHKLETATDEAYDIDGVTLAAPKPNANTTSEPGPSIASGEGIGLSIVKRLCELLNASMELQTTTGIGSKFRIVFPRSYEV